MDSPRAGTGELTAGAAGLLLLLSMFLPWFGTDATSLNAWQAFTGEDILLAATGVLALALVVARPGERAGLALFVIGAAALSVLAILLRLFYPPTIELIENGDTVFEASRRLGVFFGLLYTVAIAWGANRVAWTAEPATGAPPVPAKPSDAAAVAEDNGAGLPAEAAERAEPMPTRAPRVEPPRVPRNPEEPAPAAAQATLERPPSTHSVLIDWPEAKIEAECDSAWRSYDQSLADRYTAYFAEHPELAKSSQTLTVGLLGAAARLDPSLEWLFEMVAPVPESDSAWLEFEHTVGPELLGEGPSPTTIDVLVEHPRVVICLAGKWREAGLESCTCRGSRVGPLDAHCSKAVAGRQDYWEVATDLLAMPARERNSPCPISPSYEAVRGMAAARALAGDRLAVYALIYDATNPYFAGQGDWPGWPAVLSAAVAQNTDPDRFRFVALAWQELVSRLPLDDQARAWAAEKHGLG